MRDCRIDQRRQAPARPTPRKAIPSGILRVPEPRRLLFAIARHYRAGGQDRLEIADLPRVPAPAMLPPNGLPVAASRRSECPRVHLVRAMQSAAGRAKLRTP